VTARLRLAAVGVNPGEASSNTRSASRRASLHLLEAARQQPCQRSVEQPPAKASPARGCDNAHTGQLGCGGRPAEAEGGRCDR
jgi:hypothetical protein